jgi:2-dehydro-3-deoxyphosphogluconate aldolase/(4S)-4-hydroxy-2-oxoglutarate aldolase
MTVLEQLQSVAVLPVVTAYDVSSTLKTAEALSRGGMTAIEITLRTDAALASITAVKEALPHLILAAGTVTKPEDMTRAQDAGVDLCVSPGIAEELLLQAQSLNMPFLPGVATASEIMLGLQYGLDLFKLFPAVAVGGITLLNALRGPFPGVRFCPTGGLTRANFREFLALPNVVCCGGSWMVTESLVRGEDWSGIADLAHEARQAPVS